MIPEIKTNRLLLRRFTEKDIPAACSYVSSRENTKYMMCGVQTEEEYRAYIRFSAKDENYYIFAVTEKETGKLIGTADLGLIDDDTQAEIGWVIHRDYWNKGYCTEVGRALLSFAFDGLDLRRVIAHCDVENIGSWRVMEKIGMRREGCFVEGRRPYDYDPYYHSSEYSYAIMSDEYYRPRPDYHEKMRQLLALEFNCSPDDFLKTENILTESALKEGRRPYSSEKYFFHMATTGYNAVVTADPCLHPFLSGFIKKSPGHFLFEYPNLKPLEAELNKFGYTLTQTYHMFINSGNVVPQRNYPVKWFYDDDIKQFYGDERFPNAICSEYLPHRPDRIVVCAYDGENIMGIAGCSEDAPHWQQIGIDVLPEYRSAGVGKYLVTLLKNEIIRRGDIPFYGTSLSNYHSWNIALGCSFKPTWVEIGASKI